MLIEVDLFHQALSLLAQSLYCVYIGIGGMCRGSMVDPGNVLVDSHSFTNDSSDIDVCL